MAARTSDRIVEGRAGGALIVATVLLSAFLLFQVQPIVGRLILPWFGGGAAVWTTTLLFFQVALLAGYAYSHVISTQPARRQAIMHVALLAAATLTLPILPREWLRTESSDDPTWRVLATLTVTAGAPYVLLATTGPLLQRWVASMSPTRSPYALYALSNAASLIALLSYPVIVEPFVGVHMQAWAWSAAYIVAALATATIAWRFGHTAQHEAATRTVENTPAPSKARVALWIALTATASSMLMATTNALTQDIAAFPLLWVLPLAIYLLTFILAFAGDRFYQPVVALCFFVAACYYGFYLLGHSHLALPWLVALHTGVLFVICFGLHGETARARPAPTHLTTFYLAVAVGGALGGVFVAIIAPLLFPDFWEMHVTLLTAAALIFAIRMGATPNRSTLPAAVGGVALIVFAIVLGRDVLATRDGLVASGRNFYGVVRVYEDIGASTGLERRVMEHSGTLHGFQYEVAGMAQAPGAYYDAASGAGIAIEHHPARDERPLRVGVVGLGAGVIAAFARDGDEWTFIDINPLVIEMAESQFTYLDGARERGASVEVIEGDGRVVLDDLGESFDVIVLDAFTGGAIPTHLLTGEAFEVYAQRLAPDGVVAVHVSNRYVDLARVARAGADSVNLATYFRENPDGPSEQVIESEWVLAAADPTFAAQPEVAALLTPWPNDGRVLWTDDRADLWRVIRP